MVTGKFMGSLGSLMTVIGETEPHYIRCVKPNEDQLPMVFQVRRWIFPGTDLSPALEETSKRRSHRSRRGETKEVVILRLTL